MISFLKGQGSGNDFVILQESEILGLDLSTLANKMCRRQLGIGADGLVILSQCPHADFGYQMFNPDGTESGMCGNGLRTSVLAWRSLGHWFQNHTALIAGEIRRFEFTNNLPEVEIGPGDVHSCHDNSVLEALPEANSVKVVNVGNPHLVISVPSMPEDWIARSQLMEVHPAFPDRTNVHWVVQDTERVSVFTWERGAGVTLACGSGACAVAFALKLSQAELVFPGGLLRVRIDENGSAWLTGEAELTFSGEWPNVTAFSES